MSIVIPEEGNGIVGEEARHVPACVPDAWDLRERKTRFGITRITKKGNNNKRTEGEETVNVRISMRITYF